MRLDRPLLFLDIEATGLDVDRARIIEIACVKAFPDRRTEEFQSLVNPGESIPDGVVELTGITDDDVADAPGFREIVPSLVNLLHDADIAGYNVTNFDVPLLDAEFRRARNIMPGPADRVVIDALEILRHHEPRTLGWAFRYYLGSDMPESHRALADIKATEDVLREQIRRYNIGGTAREVAATLRHPFLDSKKRLKRDGIHVIFCFGKYSGKSLKHVAETDPSYIQWMMTSMDPEIGEILRQFVSMEPAEVV